MNIRRPHIGMRLDRSRLVDGVTVVAATAAVCVAVYAVWRFDKLMPLGHLLRGSGVDAG